jgi:hypothetical protein
MSTPRLLLRFNLREYRRFPIQCIMFFTTGGRNRDGQDLECSRGGTPLACGSALKFFLMLAEIKHGWW